mmetsp:Transcript_34606/g.42659  ORF Transcript_34606/g.42659 Transcript_34606/m.42659 type:complete len:93 (+) Transcript_34606:1-279(+)
MDVNTNIEYELYYNKKMDVLKSRILAIKTDDINPPSIFHALSNITFYFDDKNTNNISGIHCQFIPTTKKISFQCKCCSNKNDTNNQYKYQSL